ncbi:MAG: hypothetical protein OEQ13_14700, partial [Acidobacteriota bacterium]|nr:hypothetical protein [Acidobacteriota bacterium]
MEHLTNLSRATDAFRASEHGLGPLGANLGRDPDRPAGSLRGPRLRADGRTGHGTSTTLERLTSK